jgi:ribosome maturation factor RimP
VFIDTLGGLNVSDCENVSRRLGKMLDEGAFRLPERYFLQVSSPGVERPLFSFSHFRRFSGSKVRIMVKDPVGEKKTLTGIIESAENDLILLNEEESGMLEIGYGNVLKANLVFSMPGSEKPGKKKEKNKRRQQ